MLIDYVDIFEETINDVLLMRLPELYRDAKGELPEVIKEEPKRIIDPWSAKIEAWSAKEGFTRQDSWASDLANLIAATKVVFNRRTPNPETVALNIANEVSDYNKNQFQKVAKSAIGVNVVAQEPYLSTVLNAYAFKNADLIRDLSDKGARDISLIVSDGLSQ